MSSAPAFPPARRLAVAALAGSVLTNTACVFGPLEPGEPFSPGVYLVEVTVDDGCQQISVSPTPPLECRGGLVTDPEADDGLVAFWPELDGDTYVIHDGLLPEATSMPILRWSTSELERPSGCDMAEQRSVVSLSNDDAGIVNGSLRNTWSNVATCPVTPGIPRADCTTQFTYRYTLETSCVSPCELVQSDAEPAEGEPYDCGLSVCSCP